MANIRGAIEFEAGGVTRQLRYGMNAMARFQDVTGQTFLSALDKFQTDPTDMRTMRAIFWAGLGNVTVEEAGDLIDEVGFQDVAEMIRQAITAAFPQAGEAEASGNGGKKAAKAAA